MDKLIDTLRLPSGLRDLDVAALERVCEELRDELIDSVAISGGHFASSLGVTEISVALHHSFNTPQDRIIWDVGHQAYVHKMLTGRREKIKSIRTSGGISGFLKRDESVYDCFGAGHAGTSISAAVGMSTAMQREDPDKFVVAVVGDASIGTGMAFEALNHAGALVLKHFIVILNDNKMSISPNVGALSRLFSKVATSKTSTYARKEIKRLHEKGYVPEIIYKFLDRAEEATQGFFCQAGMLFESLGFRYIGPIDGHNMAELLHALQSAKEQDTPVLIHARTVKGKGYKPAEENPAKWHGVTPFDRSAGAFVSTHKLPPTYTQVFADTLIELCKKDSKIVGITAAMPSGTGLDRLEKEVPNSFFDVGICEQHAVTFAAGLACEGYRPVCAIYSTFLQRAYDQVLHDVCIQKLPVVFAIDRAGVVGNDGETHQGVFDIAYLRSIPHMTIMSPKDENELRHMLYSAVYSDGPAAIRYPRGNACGVEVSAKLKRIPLGKAEVLVKGTDVLLICFGPLVQQGLQLAKRLKTELSIGATVINARFAKPLDVELLSEEIPEYHTICILEDHALLGGFGSAVLEAINEHQIPLNGAIKLFGIQDEFIPHASQSEQHKMNACDAESIFKYIRSQIASHKVAAAG